MTSGEQEKALAEKASLAYMADYVVHRLTMPDSNGNVLQPDLTRPEEQVCQPSWARGLSLVLQAGPLS